MCVWFLSMSLRVWSCFSSSRSFVPVASAIFCTGIPICFILCRSVANSLAALCERREGLFQVCVCVLQSMCIVFSAASAGTMSSTSGCVPQRYENWYSFLHVFSAFVSGCILSFEIVYWHAVCPSHFCLKFWASSADASHSGP